MGLQRGKNAKQLGFKVGDKFRFVDKDGWGSLEYGSIVVLVEDDGTSNPYFYTEKSDGYTYCISLYKLEPLKKRNTDIDFYSKYYAL